MINTILIHQCTNISQMCHLLDGLLHEFKCKKLSFENFMFLLDCFRDHLKSLI